MRRESRLTNSEQADKGGQSDEPALDDILGLSIQFVHVLRVLPGASNTGSIYVGSRSSPTDGSGSGRGAPQSLDHGSILIMVSCYIRVLESLTDGLGSIKQQLASGVLSDRSIGLPSVVVCAYPLDSYPVMRLRMVLEFVEGVLDAMSALVVPIARESERTRDVEEATAPWRGQTLVPEDSQQALLAREDAAYQAIEDIRGLLKIRRRVSSM